VGGIGLFEVSWGVVRWTGMGTHRCRTCDGYGSNPVKSRRWYEFWKSEPCKEGQGVMSAAATTPMVWAKNRKHDSKLRFSCCDKPIKGTAYWVEVINGGSDVALPGSNPDENDAGYLGFHAIGSSCAKKHFRGFAVEQ